MNSNILKDDDDGDWYAESRRRYRERPRYRYVDVPIKRELLNEAVNQANSIISEIKQEIQELNSNPKRIFTSKLLANKLEDVTKQIEEIIKIMKERAE